MKPQPAHFTHHGRMNFYQDIARFLLHYLLLKNALFLSFYFFMYFVLAFVFNVLYSVIYSAGN